MQNRQCLAQLVLSGEVNISEIARRFGVSRPTAYLWVQRAKEQGVAHLRPHSRKPLTIARCTDLEVEALVLAQKDARPAWGAKKIHAELWPENVDPPICVRTIDRLLKRHEMTGKRGEAQGQPKHFEREGCNEVWQIDFKGMGMRIPLSPLSVLDDHSRFCLAVQPLTSRSSESVWGAMWDLFGEYGVPDCILSDNGDCFNSVVSQGPTPFQAKLWRLGVKTIHGRPYHPQTQGKVERFHRTLEAEYGSQLHLQDRSKMSIEQVRAAWDDLRQDYNWARPHEALSMRTPGSQYTSSARKRPNILPPAEIMMGGQGRKVDVNGIFEFKGRKYRAGRGLIGERVEVREGESDYELWYAAVPIASLTRLQVQVKDSPKV